MARWQESKRPRNESEPDKCQWTGHGYEFPNGRDALLFLGNSAAVIPWLLRRGYVRRSDAVVSDPPYGCRNDCDYTRFTGSLHRRRNHFEGITGDDEPFDPNPFLKFRNVVLCGYQFFAKRIPRGTILVWNKRRPNQLGNFLSDCELIWQKGGRGCYLFNHVWHGFDRESERGKSLHPSQKPVALFDWIFSRLKLPPDTVILDPFMGTGPIGVAAIKAGYHYIGIELVESYFSLASARIGEFLRESHAADCRQRQVAGA